MMEDGEGEPRAKPGKRIARAHQDLLKERGALRLVSRGDQGARDRGEVLEGVGSEIEVPGVPRSS